MLEKGVGGHKSRLALDGPEGARGERGEGDPFCPPRQVLRGPGPIQIAHVADSTAARYRAAVARDSTGHRAVRRAAMLADKALGASTFGTYLSDPALVYEAARAVNDVQVVAGAAALANLLTNNCPENVLSRAINANYRIGGPPAAMRLAMFAAKTNGPVSARVDALGCLADWEQPSDLDRVIGLHRPVPANLRRRLRQFAVRPEWPIGAAQQANAMESWPDPLSAT